MKPDLQRVTLVIVDCVDYERAKKSFDKCTTLCNFKEAKILTSLSISDPFVSYIEKISSMSEYSQFIMFNLADHFSTDFVLVAQWDGFVWNPELWSEDFLNYDYVGAPWPESCIFPGVPKHFNVGNGGFSLRSKKLQDFLKQDEFMRGFKYLPEDVAICQKGRAYLESKGFTFAPFEVAQRFSWEHGVKVPAFGVHYNIKL